MQPLEDRRLSRSSILPGQQQTWFSKGGLLMDTVNLPPSLATRQLDTLPIRMPLKSKELFHYCILHYVPMFYQDLPLKLPLVQQVHTDVRSAPQPRKLDWFVSLAETRCLRTN
jgi:hypothetical protein